jgi:hypothetical protein
VAKAIALPDVAKIECCDTKEGIDLAMSVPHKDVVAEVHPDAAVKGSWVEARCSSISEEEVNL